MAYPPRYSHRRRVRGQGLQFLANAEEQNKTGWILCTGLTSCSDVSANSGVFGLGGASQDFSLGLTVMADAGVRAAGEWARHTWGGGGTSGAVW